MEDKQLFQIWEEIIATADNGDAEYSFALFKGYVNKETTHKKNG